MPNFLLPVFLAELPELALHGDCQVIRRTSKGFEEVGLIFLSQFSLQWSANFVFPAFRIFSSSYRWSVVCSPVVSMQWWAFSRQLIFIFLMICWVLHEFYPWFIHSWLYFTQVLQVSQSTWPFSSCWSRSWPLLQFQLQYLIFSQQGHWDLFKDVFQWPFRFKLKIFIHILV